LDILKEKTKNAYENSIAKIITALDKLKEKEAVFKDSNKLRNYGDLILSNMSTIKPGDKWLEVIENGIPVRIELDPFLSPQASAAKYYDQYRKTKSGLVEIQEEITAGEEELKELRDRLDRLLTETDPKILLKLVSAKNIENSGGNVQSASVKIGKKTKTRPGLTFKRGDWLILVGRDASENDELLRRHVKGNDLWLHARDFHGSYVFIRHRTGKTVPLDILLDAGNLAVFYSKGRNNAEGDLFYTPVKYLRRVKNGPKGLVIPTQEKNLFIKIDEKRLRTLKNSRIL
jgi:predicted ribosome quality control (RQC) complex YloA/Tae2 family protein